MISTGERLPNYIIEQAKRTDVRDLAGNYTTLRRESATSQCGPCPRCGGTNRFYCKDDHFVCRVCHPAAGDAIAFLRWVQPGLSFVDAVQQLTGVAGMAFERRRPVRKASPIKVQPPEWKQRSDQIVTDAQTRLASDEGAAGLAYLYRRALTPATWSAFGVGFVPDAPLAGTHGKRRAPALVFPWRSRSAGVYGVRYRFIEKQTYTDDDNNEHVDVRLTAEYGSDFAGKLFGGQALSAFVFADTTTVAAERTLLIVEGEINAMSLWQVAAATNVDVLSVGSESTRLTEHAEAVAARFGRCIVWADREAIAQRMASELPGAYAVVSPGGQDANDLLVAGLLGGFVATVRLRATRHDHERRCLLDGLVAAADRTGLDAGTAAVLRQVAAQVGEPVDLLECTDGLWRTIPIL
jgi:hypothetical protein